MNTVKRTPIKSPEPGVYKDIPADDCHKWDALAQSTISRFIRSPKAGAWYMQGTPTEATPAMQLGTAIHSAVLEPELFSKLAVQTDVGPTAVVGYRDAQEEHPGKIILRKGQGETIAAMKDELYAHPKASEILNESGSPREISVVWDEHLTINGESTPIRCKARLDLYSPKYHAVFDVKKVAKDGGDYDSFHKAIWNNGYHRQAAWYARGAVMCGLTDTRPDYAWICVEEKPPYEIDLYQACDEMMQIGWNECKLGMSEYVRYRLTGNAPGRSNSIRPINLPAWAKPRNETQAHAI